MAGILANSATSTMASGDTAVDKIVSGYITNERIALSITPSGDSFAFSTTQSYHQIFSPVLDALDQRVDQTWVDFDKGVREDDAC